MSPLPLVIVRDFDVVRINANKTEANPPLVVDGDGVLTNPITFQRVKPVAARHPQVI